MPQVQSVRSAPFQKNDGARPYLALKITLLVLSILLGGAAAASHFMGWGGEIALISLSGASGLFFITSLFLHLFGKRETSVAKVERAILKKIEVPPPSPSVSSQIGDEEELDADPLPPLPPPSITSKEREKLPPPVVIGGPQEPTKAADLSVFSAPPPLKHQVVSPAVVVAKEVSPEELLETYLEKGCEAKELLELLRKKPDLVKKKVSKEMGSVLHFLFMGTQGPIAIAGLSDLFRTFLERHPFPINLVDGDGKTLLHCVAGNARICDFYGNHIKTQEIRFEMVALLIKKGCDRHLKDTLLIPAPLKPAPRFETTKEMLARITKVEEVKEMVQRLKRPNESGLEFFQRLRLVDEGPVDFYYRLRQVETPSRRYLRLRKALETEEEMYRRLAQPNETKKATFERLSQKETREQVVHRLALSLESENAMIERLKNRNETLDQFFVRQARKETPEQFYQRCGLFESNEVMLERLSQRHESEEDRIERLNHREMISEPNETPLHKAVKISNNLKVTQGLFSPKGFFEKNYEGLTPLHIALLHAHDHNAPFRIQLNDREQELLEMLGFLLKGFARETILCLHFPAETWGVKKTKDQLPPGALLSRETHMHERLTVMEFVKTHNFSTEFRETMSKLLSPNHRN